MLAASWLITEPPESCQPLGRFCDWLTSGKHKQKLVRVEGPLLKVHWNNSQEHELWYEFNSKHVFAGRGIVFNGVRIANTTECAIKIERKFLLQELFHDNESGDDEVPLNYGNDDEVFLNEDQSSDNDDDLKDSPNEKDSEPDSIQIIDDNESGSNSSSESDDHQSSESSGGESGVVGDCDFNNYNFQSREWECLLRLEAKPYIVEAVERSFFKNSQFLITSKC